ncbi:MAG: hypothetical protein WDW38_003881 [Sanguina aurantia]
MLHPAPLTNPRYNCSVLPMLSGQRVQHTTYRCKLTSVPPSVAGTSLTECPPSQPIVAGAPSCDEEELPSGSSIPSPSSPSINTHPVDINNTSPNPPATSTTLTSSSISSSSSAPHGYSQPSSPPQPHQASPPLPYATSQAASPPPPSNSQAGPATSTPPPAPSPQSTPSPSISSSSGFQIQPLHILLFTLIFVGGAIFATMTIQFTADVNFNVAAQTVVRRVAKSMAFRQLCIISGAILVVRFGLNNLFHMLARFAPNAVPWEKTKLYYVLREVYQPLELLLFIAAICTLAESFVPQVVAIPKPTVSHFVKSTMSVSFLMATANVIFNLKSRWCKENAWQGEMKGDQTGQRRWEAYDKLGSFIIFAMTFVLGVQAIGLEVTSVLAIGGIGGLAIGLAGREICENLLNGLIIMTTNPFEVGDEVHFFHTSKNVEGIVIDIGWYRTLIRSFEREVYVIPNAVFSKNIVLNISRKNKEWRFHENLSIRVQDVDKCQSIVQDIRRVVRNDARVMNKLHRRIFMDKVTQEDVKIYISFYADAPNREAFMTIKQDLLLAFIDCVERQGGRGWRHPAPSCGVNAATCVTAHSPQASPRWQPGGVRFTDPDGMWVDMDPELMRSMASLGPILNAAAANMAKAASDARSSSSSGPSPFTPVLAISDGGTITTDTTLSSRSSSSSTNSSGGGGSWDRLPTQTSSGSSNSGVTGGAAAAGGGGWRRRRAVAGGGRLRSKLHGCVEQRGGGSAGGGAATPVARPPQGTPLRNAGSSAVLERSEDQAHPFVQAMNTALNKLASAVFEP